MDVRSYCDTIGNQLTGWKASIYDVLRHAEKLNEQDKKSVQPTINVLNRIVDDLNNSLTELQAQCPADWSPRKQDIDSKLGELRKNFEQLSEKLGSLLPDSTAWV